MDKSKAYQNERIEAALTYSRNAVLRALNFVRDSHSSGDEPSNTALFGHSLQELRVALAPGARRISKGNLKHLVGYEGCEKRPFHSERSAQGLREYYLRPGSLQGYEVRAVGLFQCRKPLVKLNLPKAETRPFEPYVGSEPCEKYGYSPHYLMTKKNQMDVEGFS